MSATKSLWADLVENGRKNQSHKEVNVFDKDDINTILGTVDFFGASELWMRQIFFDLTIAKYRFFDALAMYVQGRADDSEDNKTGLKVLCYAFIDAGYNEKKFIDNLRYNDYEIIRDWESVKLD